MIARCNEWTESPIKMWNCEDFVKQHLWAERCKAVHERSTFWEVFLGCVAANGVTEVCSIFTWSTTFESVGGKLGKCWLHNWSLSFAKSYSPFSTPLSWKRYLHLQQWKCRYMMGYSKQEQETKLKLTIQYPAICCGWKSTDYELTLFHWDWVATADRYYQEAGNDKDRKFLLLCAGKSSFRARYGFFTLF